jgi:restriction system protein
MFPLDLLQIFKPLLWVIPIILLIGVVKSPWFKGIIGESLVKLVAKIRLPADVYFLSDKLVADDYLSKVLIAS